MFRSDLILQILAVFVLNILFLQCGAERDIIRGWNDDDLRPHFFTIEPDWRRFTFSPDDFPTYEHKPMETMPLIVFVVFGFFMLLIFIGYHVCKSYSCDDLLDSESDVTVHPPPANRYNNAPSSRDRSSHTRNFVSPRSSSTTLTLVPEDNQYFSAFIATAVIDAPPPRNTTDKPPDYASVVISDLSSSVASKYPVVRSDQVPDSPPPKYDSRDLHM